MGVGKSTVGKKLARILEWEYFDTDVYFEKKYKVKISTFFNKYDEILFRKLENEILHETKQLQNVIVSTGGGMPCYMDSMDFINKNGISVYLKMNKASIFQRLKGSKQKRPLVVTKTDDQLKRYIYQELDLREPSYSKACIVFSALSADVKELATQVKEYL